MPAETNAQQAERLIGLCDQIRQHLLEAQRGLGSARNWGIVDILGGGMLTTFIKHRKIDNAQSSLERANVLMQDLGRELKQIGKPGELHIDRGGFGEFADYFFDNIFSDMFMQSKINELRRQVDDTLVNLERVRDTLVTARQYAMEHNM